MNDEFSITTEERISKIAEEFNVKRESVELLHKEFRVIEAEIKKQRLAHLTRVLESYCKKITGNQKFFIEYVPYKVRTPRMRGAMSTIFHQSFNKFTIYYDDTLPQRNIRVNIAHELGHLYLNARYYSSGSGSQDAIKGLFYALFWLRRESV